jgi:oxygen-dependent protoporphyrinogen oxidase
VLVRTFFGRWGDEAILAEPDDALVKRARDDLRTVAGVATEPVLVRVHRWMGGMPQYVVGHGERLAKIRARLARLPGVFIAGASYDGVGIPDCIASGWAAADAALAGAAVVA